MSPTDPVPVHPGRLRWRDAVCATDAAAVAELVRRTGAFSEEEMAIAEELVQDRQRRGAESGYEFLFAEAPGEGGGPPKLVGYTCYGSIPGTRWSWDLYWIAVEPEAQGLSVGSRLLEETERRIERAGGRRLYVETSGRDDYARARRFYRRAGYEPEARLRDFYAPGDPKVIFVKELQAAPE